MKKYALTFAVASALALPFGMANAATGSVDFIGEVTNETCSLGADSIQITVPLGSYSSFHLENLDRTEAREFQINLTGCDTTQGPGATADFAFTGTPASAADLTQLGLNPEGGSAAGNLGIGISANGNDLTASRVSFDGSVAQSLALQDGTNSLRLYAFYEKLATGSVSAGPANATATFEVTYR